MNLKNKNYFQNCFNFFLNLFFCYQSSRLQLHWHQRSHQHSFRIIFKQEVLPVLRRVVGPLVVQAFHRLLSLNTSHTEDHHLHRPLHPVFHLHLDISIHHNCRLYRNFRAIIVLPLHPKHLPGLVMRPLHLDFQQQSLRRLLLILALLSLRLQGLPAMAAQPR